jgi:hypothetical protein
MLIPVVPGVPFLLVGMELVGLGFLLPARWRLAMKNAFRQVRGTVRLAPVVLETTEGKKT